jgi:hypothetical protein
MKRPLAIVALFIAVFLVSFDARSAPRNKSTIAQKWIDGWNSPDPAKLVAAFTPDGIYEDVTFGLKKQGSAQLRELV